MKKNAFVKPHMLYFATVWSKEAPAETVRMDADSRHAARVILRDPNVELNANTFMTLDFELLESSK